MCFEVIARISILACMLVAVEQKLLDIVYMKLTGEISGTSTWLS